MPKEERICSKRQWSTVLKAEDRSRRSTEYCPLAFAIPSVHTFLVSAGVRILLDMDDRYNPEATNCLIMIEVVCNDRLGKKVRLRRHHQRSEEIDSCSDGNTVGEDSPEEVMKVNFAFHLKIKVPESGGGVERPQSKLLEV
ncbi:unnamed protein product [Ranitomeya imitator]|uniref:Uncharacterized protein n=1 Tax=Ranitomeya imitator TaxID=111125 RepID=A0ABN9LJF9_9NEOB|nr:unnamed protein product [Ranitomeya imitator]